MRCGASRVRVRRGEGRKKPRTVSAVRGLFLRRVGYWMVRVKAKLVLATTLLAESVPMTVMV